MQFFKMKCAMKFTDDIMNKNETAQQGVDGC